MNYIRFSGFFFVQNLSRGLLLSVIPLQALTLLQDVQSVSVLFFSVSAGGIVAALTMPFVVGRLGNYRTFLIATGAMGLSLVALSSLSPGVFSVGLFLHVFSIAAAEVSLTIYVLGLIPRRDMLRFEPWRMLFSVLALTIGPFLGVFLQERVHHLVPFVVSAITVVGALIYFHRLRLHHTVLKSSAGALTTNPLTHIGRFFTQPRLRLGYGLILARSCWWTMFVIYAPIYAEQTGLGKLTGAAIVSIGTAWTLTVPFWGWVGRRFGLRYLMGGGFLASGLLTLLVFSFAQTPDIASWLLVISALGASVLDGAGNVLFFRAVRAHERSEMAAVFSTYRDVGQLTTPGMFAVLLKFFTLPVVFATAGTWMLISAWFCRYIPKGMK